MYIKTYGDISQYKATDAQKSEINKLTDYYEKDKNQIRIMTYNLLADSIGFEGSPAESRADRVCQILEGISPDVCGLQETSRKWFACILNNTHYKFIQPVRTALFDTMTVLVYNPKTVTPLAFGEKVFENGNNSPLRRMVWGVFLHKETDKIFAVINTHFSLSGENLTDNTTPLTQALELITLSKELKNIFQCPVFPIGDFNAKVSTNKKPSPIYDILTSAFINTKTLSNAISNGENTSKKSNSIDHIFIFGNANIIQHATLSQNFFKELSDHYPVFCDVFI